MSAVQVLEEIDKLPFEEQREVFERLRDKFDVEPTAEQIAEFERRGEELRQHPERGIHWEQIRAELKDELTPGEIELVDRRLREHFDNPDDVISMEELKAKLDAKYAK